MIAVTGSTGFLGKHVLQTLRERKINFSTLLRRDLSNVERLAESLKGVEQILHLAGQINGSVKELEEANVELMKRLLLAARGRGIRRIIYVSSAAAQFRHGPYGQTKWEAEEILKASGIPCLIFRPTLLYGKGDTKNVATMDWLIRRFPYVPLLDGGNFLIQPLYVEDAVEVLMRALESSITDRVYHLAGPVQISLKEMIEVIAESLRKRIRFFSVPLKWAKSLVRVWAFLFPKTRLPVKQILELDRHRAFDIEDARRDFGFDPRPFKEGILAMRGSEALCAG